MSQEFDKNVLDLVKQKGFYLYEYMSNFEKFKEESPSKEKFYSSLTDRQITGKEFLMLMFNILNVWKKISNEKNERLPRLVFKARHFVRN